MVAILYCFMNGEVRPASPNYRKPIAPKLNVNFEDVELIVDLPIFKRCSMRFRGDGGDGSSPSTCPVGPGSITAPSATVGLLTHRCPCCPALQAATQPPDSLWILWRCDFCWDWLLCTVEAQLTISLACSYTGILKMCVAVIYSNCHIYSFLFSFPDI